MSATKLPNLVKIYETAFKLQACKKIQNMWDTLYFFVYSTKFSCLVCRYPLQLPKQINYMYFPDEREANYKLKNNLINHHMHK